MSFNHSLTTEICFHPGVSARQIDLAMEPLINYMGGIENIDEYRMIFSESESAENEKSHTLCLNTSGDVNYAYHDVLVECAENLKGLCKPNFFSLYNHDDGYHHDAFTQVWFGESREIVQAKRAWAWTQARNLLGENGFDETELKKVDLMIEAFCCSLNEDRSNSDTPKKHLPRIVAR